MTVLALLVKPEAYTRFKTLALSKNPTTLPILKNIKLFSYSIVFTCVYSFTISAYIAAFALPSNRSGE
jgi:hypothetical protein